MPPKCKTCLHPDVKTINSQIRTSVSLRNIALQFGMSHTAVSRHAETCLGFTIGALIEQKKIKQAIDVHEEFREQLEFAKQLRTAAREYLNNPDDPLKLIIIPRADEIDVVYFDYAEKDEKGNPKKKTANLHALLQRIECDEDTAFEPDKIQIKHIDLRKFALDAINTADTCIDKFAKLSGAYTQDKVNPDKTADVLLAFNDWLSDNPEASSAEKSLWISRFAKSGNVEPRILAEKAGIEMDIIG